MLYPPGYYEYIVAVVYNFCPAEDGFYEEWDLEGCKMMFRLANIPAGNNCLFVINEDDVTEI